MSGVHFAALIIALTSTIIVFTTQIFEADSEKRYYSSALKIGAMLLPWFLVITDNVFTFCAITIVADFVLALLSFKEASWPAARTSASIATNNLFISSGLMCVGALLLYWSTDSTSIEYIAAQKSTSSAKIALAICLLIASAAIKNGLWPFDKWMLNSSNLPASQLAMINAGGLGGINILLIKLAALLNGHQWLMHVMLGIGALNLVLGGFVFFFLLNTNASHRHLMWPASCMIDCGLFFVLYGASALNLAVSFWISFRLGGAILLSSNALLKNYLDIILGRSTASWINYAIFACCLALCFYIEYLLSDLNFFALYNLKAWQVIIWLWFAQLVMAHILGCLKTTPRLYCVIYSSFLSLTKPDEAVITPYCAEGKYKKSN